MGSGQSRRRGTGGPGPAAGGPDDHVGATSGHAAGSQAPRSSSSPDSSRVVVGLPLRTPQLSPAPQKAAMAGKDDVFEKASNIFVVLGASVSQKSHLLAYNEGDGRCLMKSCHACGLQGPWSLHFHIDLPFVPAVIWKWYAQIEHSFPSPSPPPPPYCRVIWPRRRSTPHYGTH